MKPVDFDYEQAKSVDEAITLLTQSADALILAGGQTLGPMLNLRLVQPELLIADGILTDRHGSNIII